jgi:choline dehydrogenase-like flavoprotein
MSSPFHDAATEGVVVDSADYVIVGSGAGGGAAARTLAESGRSVVVLEEGPYVPSSQFGPLAFEGMHQLMRHSGQMAALGSAAVPILQARCVGGTTLVNSAIIWRLPDAVLAKWHKEYGLADGLRANELEDAYNIIEKDMGVRPVSPEIANNSDHKLRDGAERAGVEHRAIRRNEIGCKGSGRCVLGCANDAKQSTMINYLRRAIDAGARVVSQAKVERIMTEGGKAVGVRGTIQGRGVYAQRSFRVQAKRAVIVSASVIQSPNLLRRSGVGRSNDALGNHFMGHPGTALAGVYKERIDTWTGAAQGYEAYGLRDTLGVKFESINVPPEVAASRLPGFGATYAKYLERMPFMAIWSAALKAEAQGTVRPSRLFGGDLIRYELTRNDLDRLRQGLKRLAEMHFLAGATEVMPSVHGLPDSITADQLSVFDSAPLNPQAYSMVTTHLFGTCRAGADPRHAVVDPFLRVHDTPGLYVMDASIFPSNTGVNPQHSIMAISTVAAKRLAAA